MKNSTLILLIFLIILSFCCKDDAVLLESSALNGTVSVYYDAAGNKYILVKGYTKKNGTAVKAYYRSLPNKDKTDNWSTKGNINPFTGKKGYEKTNK